MNRMKEAKMPKKVLNGKQEGKSGIKRRKSSWMK